MGRREPEASESPPERENLRESHARGPARASPCPSGGFWIWSSTPVTRRVRMHVRIETAALRMEYSVLSCDASCDADCDKNSRVDFAWRSSQSW